MLLRHLIPAPARRRVARLIGRADAPEVAPPVSRGQGCWIERSRFGLNVRLGSGVEVRDSELGDYTYVESHAVVGHATLGKFCSIAPRAFVGLGSHPSSGYVSTHPAFYIHEPAIGLDLADRTYRDSYARTTVGHDVWVGVSALVRDGVVIGTGAVVGAGAVVTRDVEPYTVVAGVPARPIRRRFDDETVDFLLRLAWWDRSADWMREHLPLFHDVAVMRAALGPEVGAPVGVEKGSV